MGLHPRLEDMLFKHSSSWVYFAFVVPLQRIVHALEESRVSTFHKLGNVDLEACVDILMHFQSV